MLKAQPDAKLSADDEDIVEEEEVIKILKKN